MTKQQKAKTTTITDFAARVGASPKAVTGSITRGELPPECVTVDGFGRRAIVNVERAEAAWNASRAPRAAQAPKSSANAEIAWRKSVIMANHRVAMGVEALLLTSLPPYAVKALRDIEARILEVDGLLSDGACGPQL